jgi:hypothetical protein
MKKLYILISILILFQKIRSQENYRDFEGIKKVVFAEWSGVIDSSATNPSPNAVNASVYCAKYIRDTSLYDNFKMFPFNKLGDISSYASNALSAPKIKIKVYTTAPAGTNIQLQLGTRSNGNFPAGVHSIYTATTTVSHAWEELKFNFMQSGGFTNSSEINKIVVLFHPNSHNRDTVYFDDPSGPETIPVGIPEYESSVSFRLFQNKPNPAKENTNIKLQVNSSGHVTLKLYDILGKAVATMLDQEMTEGVYFVPVETGNLPDGIYFYVLKKEGITQTRRMVISK